MKLQIKKCTLNNLSELKEFSEKLFYNTYKGSCSEEDMDSYLEESFNIERMENELKSDDTEFYFLYGDNELCGYMKLKDIPPKAEPENKDFTELERIYVSDKHQHAGLGSFLLNSAKNIAAGHGKKYIWLSVWQENAKAISFYKKHGFEVIDTQGFVVGGDIQMDYIMKISV